MLSEELGTLVGTKIVNGLIVQEGVEGSESEQMNIKVRKAEGKRVRDQISEVRCPMSAKQSRTPKRIREKQKVRRSSVFAKASPDKEGKRVSRNCG